MRSAPLSSGCRSIGPFQSVDGRSWSRSPAAPSPSPPIEGPDAEIDRTYSRVGRFVAERDIGRDAPVRERYLAGVLGDSAELITEINWPVQNQ